MLNFLPLHPPLIIQGRVDFESDASNDGSAQDGSSSTTSESGDEYEEYSYDSPSSDSGGPIDKELQPLKVAKKQLSLGEFSY